MSEKIFIGNDDKKNLKRKREELEPKHEKSKVMQQTSESDVKDLLTLRLGIHTKSTIKSLEIGEHSSSYQNVVESVSQNATNEPLPQNTTNEPLHKQEVRELICHYCDKKFSTSQSLGGYQNAHQHERASKKMEKQRRKAEEMNSTLRFSYSYNQLYPYQFPSPIHYQGYSYLHRANLNYPISSHNNNVMPSWTIGSPSNSYGGLHISNSSPTTPQFPTQMPNSSFTIPQFGMTNFRSGGQNVALPIPQRLNTLGLRQFAQANQTPSIAKGTERNFNAQFRSQTLPLLSHANLIQINHVSSSPTQTTSEALNLNLTL
ncbi:hypothetical protein TSUD_13300 [Trifolium subterraneum]|uniref:C2H2-type domain-containing protein n=1 Tax=Trifolium subterraneum TaxID=3900 RepID=A0A2Z6P316_TRISU|nr:hypothetical protein TSUD_13300 [Trifolium subterraneum]